jgi:hypothetical protein
VNAIGDGTCGWSKLDSIVAVPFNNDAKATAAAALADDAVVAAAVDDDGSDDDDDDAIDDDDDDGGGAAAAFAHVVSVDCNGGAVVANALAARLAFNRIANDYEAFITTSE